MKNQKTLKNSGLHLRRKPVRPEPHQMMNVGRKFPPNYLHESWMDFLYWDAELDAY